MRCYALIQILIITASTCSSQYFNNIEIRIHKDNKTVVLIAADQVNNEEQATDIWIEGQNVPILKQGTFENLLKLKQIKLQHNDLEDIEKGAFKNLTELRVLNLNFNLLRTIRGGIFSDLHVTNLYLVGNAIETIEVTAFNDLPYLQVLDVSRNKISTLHSHMFKGTTNLRQINFSLNKIQTVPQDCFNGALTHVVKKQDSFIDLSHNQIDYLNLKSIKGIYNIKRLSLNNNNIEQLDPNIFSQIQYLEVVDLEGNSLRSLNDVILRRLAVVGTETINLYANPWNCSFVKKYTRWCVKYAKNNTIDPTVLTECK